jgi:hypothetical protein
MAFRSRSINSFSTISQSSVGKSIPIIPVRKGPPRLQITVGEGLGGKFEHTHLAQFFVIAYVDDEGNDVCESSRPGGQPSLRWKFAQPQTRRVDLYKHNATSPSSFRSIFFPSALHSLIPPLSLLVSVSRHEWYFGEAMKRANLEALGDGNDALLTASFCSLM